MGEENIIVNGFIYFLIFAFSVIAAVLAIDLYSLLRTGESGKTWRVLIIASVVFALSHALRLIDWLTTRHAAPTSPLADIAQLIFVAMLAYAFYQQRVVFSGHHDAATTPAESAPTATSHSASDEDDDFDDNTDDDEAGSEDIEWEPKSQTSRTSRERTATL